MNTAFGDIYVEPTLQNSPFNRPSAKVIYSLGQNRASYDAAFTNPWDMTNGANIIDENIITSGSEYAMKQPFYHP